MSDITYTLDELKVVGISDTKIKALNNLKKFNKEQQWLNFEKYYNSDNEYRKNFKDHVLFDAWIKMGKRPQ